MEQVKQKLETVGTALLHDLGVTDEELAGIVKEAEALAKGLEEKAEEVAKEVAEVAEKEGVTKEELEKITGLSEEDIEKAAKALGGN